MLVLTICDPLSVESSCTASHLSSNIGKPSDSLRLWMGMHGMCTQLLPDLCQITTCDGHCWHRVESRGYPGRIKRALAAVYYQQSPALASWPTKHTREAKKEKKDWSDRGEKRDAWGQGLIMEVHNVDSSEYVRKPPWQIYILPKFISSVLQF